MLEHCLFNYDAPVVCFWNSGILAAIDIQSDHSLVRLFYCIGFGMFCLESVLSIWIIQQVYMYVPGSGKAAKMKRKGA
ncbi:hypothetical protein ABKV19_006674 [Rosa sericea]